MCDYRKESLKAVNSLPVPLNQAGGIVGTKAYKILASKISSGRVRQGCDLYSGKPLLQAELLQGHYMSAVNYNRFLANLNKQPNRCAWCGGKLPQNLVQQHYHVTHREVEHHFHQKCRQAQLIAIACIFGYINANQIKSRPKALINGTRQPKKAKKAKLLLLKTEVTVKKTQRYKLQHVR